MRDSLKAHLLKAAGHPNGDICVATGVSAGELQRQLRRPTIEELSKAFLSKGAATGLAGIVGAAFVRKDRAQIKRLCRALGMSEDALKDKLDSGGFD